MAGCVSFALGDGWGKRFPLLDFERKAGHFRKHSAYLEVAEANGLFEAPTAFAVRHSGWAQEKLAGVGMEPL